eukprot:XP_014771033.1 PREDICTED: myb-like protein F [Octopus bimaculoides]
MDGHNNVNNPANTVSSSGGANNGNNNNNNNNNNYRDGSTVDEQYTGIHRGIQELCHIYFRILGQRRHNGLEKWRNELMFQPENAGYIFNFDFLLRHSMDTGRVYDEEITLEEVEIELKLLKNNKTADIDGIPGEIVKYGEEAMETASLNLLNVIRTDKKIEKWKTAIIENLEIMVIFVVVECGRESVRGNHYSGFSDCVKQVEIKNGSKDLQISVTNVKIHCDICNTAHLKFNNNSSNTKRKTPIIVYNRDFPNTDSLEPLIVYTNLLAGTSNSRSRQIRLLVSYAD